MRLFDDCGSSSDRQLGARDWADDVNDLFDNSSAADLIPGWTSSVAATPQVRYGVVPGPLPGDPAVSLPADPVPLPPVPEPTPPSSAPEVYQGKTGPALYSYEKATGTEASSGGGLAAIGALAIGGLLLLGPKLGPKKRRRR